MIIVINFLFSLKNGLKGLKGLRGSRALIYPGIA